jgi:hypothetical protein
MSVQYGFVNYKKGALDSQPQVIKFTSCLPMVDGSLSPGIPASSTTKTGRHDIAENIVESGAKTPISKYSTKKAFDKSSSFINICMTRYTCVYGGSVNEKPSHQ